MKGDLVVISGSMYGRKSLELIEEVKNWEFSEIPYMAFSPVKEEIFSRSSKETVPATLIHMNHPGMISYSIGAAINSGKDVKAVAIDEVSFYDKEIVSTITSLLNEGIDVTVAGLDLDFRGQPFGSIGDLMALAKEVRKRYSVCMKCKRETATRTQRLLEDGITPAPLSTPLIVVDGDAKYKYECRCKNCYERG